MGWWRRVWWYRKQSGDDQKWSYCIPDAGTQPILDSYSHQVWLEEVTLFRATNVNPVADSLTRGVHSQATSASGANPKWAVWQLTLIHCSLHELFPQSRVVGAEPWCQCFTGAEMRLKSVLCPYPAAHAVCANMKRNVLVNQHFINFHY